MTDHTLLARCLAGTLALSCLFAMLPAEAGCVLAGAPAAERARWKADGFAVADAGQRAQRALALADCLDEADPEVRDGIAFEALSHWMRGKQLDTDTLRALQGKLLRRLDGDDDDGFGKPFAALVLSEVVRTDRVQAWMSPAERDRMAAAAADYLRSVQDRRGYVDGEGWRHGVAHAADWALQLSLDKAFEPRQLWPVLDALATQVAPEDGHAYAFGEPIRLARPVAYAAARGDLDPPAMDAWLRALPDRLGARPAGAAQALWWKRRANLEAFLHALGFMVAGDTSPPLVALAASVNATLQRLP